MDDFIVKFRPQKKSVRVRRGTDLLSAAVKAGVALNSACGGEGLCGKCKVIIKKGETKTEPSRFLNESDRKKGVVLACETIVEGDLEVSVPKESVEKRAVKRHDAEEFSKGIVLKREGAFAHAPLVEKLYLELPGPTADDNTADLDRVYRELEGRSGGLLVSTKIANVRLLGDILRESDFKVTLALAYKEGAVEIIAMEPGDTSAKNLGFAFDIGTTTVAGQLIDLKTKKVLGSRIAYNKQAAFGSDVIMRIIHGSNPKGLEELSGAVVENINEIIDDLLVEAGIDRSDVYSLVAAGNMTMMHLLLKIDPTHIRKAPYIPTTTSFSPVNSSEAGIRIHPKGVLYCLPGVTTYIGGDIVGGVLASGVFESDDVSLLVDIGTNGEIVLGNREWMIGAAASAGPAFEGSGLVHGMKAVAGAIDKVGIDEKFDVKFRTIGNERPKGLCGSAYIDILREMLKRKIMTKAGKIDSEIKSKRIRKGAASAEFVVAFKGDTAIGKDIVIDEDDIENLKRAKGAIYSAILSLFRKVEKDISEAKKVYVAGGFGNYIGIENAIAIGLLPDIDRGAYEYIGNSSLAGARMSLLSRDALAKTHGIAKGITYIDLSSEPAYMDEYIASLFFPHTDIGRFPSARS